ncbi:hypothetical protein LG299_12590 [Microbacterium lacus]|uniref:hypothetical protein n=1 Tax=Microbacterium lacus TaxID=415217 RepID=UPI00384CD8B6
MSTRTRVLAFTLTAALTLGGAGAAAHQGLTAHAERTAASHAVAVAAYKERAAVLAERVTAERAVALEAITMAAAAAPGIDATAERTTLDGLVEALFTTDLRALTAASTRATSAAGTIGATLLTAQSQADAIKAATEAASAAVAAAGEVGVDASAVTGAMPAFAGALPTVAESAGFDVDALTARTTELITATQAEQDRRTAAAAAEAARQAAASQPRSTGGGGGGSSSTGGGSSSAGGHAALEALIRSYGVGAPIHWDATNGGGYVVNGAIHLDPSLTNNAWGRYAATHEAGHIITDGCLQRERPGATELKRSDRTVAAGLKAQYGVSAHTIREWAADSFAANQGFGQRAYGGPHIGYGC